jgi:hypothetical protein
MTPNLFIFGPERSGTTLLSFLLSGQPGSFVINDSFIFDRFVKDFLYFYPQFPILPQKYNIKVNKWYNLISYIFFKNGFSELFNNNPERIAYLEHKSKFNKVNFNEYLSTEDDAVIFLKSIKEFYANRKDKWINQYARYIQFKEIIKKQESIQIQTLLDNTLTQISKKYKTEELLIFGEKTPLHTLYGEELLDKYQHSKGILLVKNPLDNVASIYKRSQNFNTALRTFSLYQSSLLRLNNHNKVYSLIFDDLVAKTYETLNTIHKFMEVDLKIDENLPIYNYIKGNYTGNSIDPGRLQKTESILTNKQKSIIFDRFRNIFETFDFKYK